ncbi:TPA: efflux RND transporter periplasmic adaptor subunit [Aeromonas salmonicida]|nr:efflux RND transporter periplasmic adaptor subunit [Aeromonas salmonicida]
MKRSHQVVFAATLIVVAITAGMLSAFDHSYAPDDTAITNAQPTLSVATTSPRLAQLPINIAASGNITAWHEASIGNETEGLRLAEVRVNVGDVVQRGQVLATFAADRVNAELAQSRAAVAEAEAVLTEAADDVKRALELQATGALSAQQIQQYTTAAKTAKARLTSAQAQAKNQQLRLEQTQVRSPDDGIISARTATIGAVLPVGQELFRLISGSRLEWRAEVSAEYLSKLKPGQKVLITPVGGKTLHGSLRMVAPIVDTQTRNGLVYVDLPQDSHTRAGTFARGQFELGATEVLTLPPSAVQLRDGFSYVMRLGPDSRVIQTKVSTGQRTANLIEIIDGIELTDHVVATGGAFLGDGDLVRVIAEQPDTQHSKLSSGAGAQPDTLM